MSQSQGRDSRPEGAGRLCRLEADRSTRMLTQRPFNDRGYRAEVRTRISCTCTTVSREPGPFLRCSPQLRTGRRVSRRRPAPESYDARQQDIAASALQLSVQECRCLQLGVGRTLPSATSSLACRNRAICVFCEVWGYLLRYQPHSVPTIAGVDAQSDAHAHRTCCSARRSGICRCCISASSSPDDRAAWSSATQHRKQRHRSGSCRLLSPTRRVH